MKSSSCRSFEVYDFNEEDDSAEVAAARYLGNYKTPENPNSETPAIMKYELLSCAARGDVVKAKEIDNVQWVDVDAIDNEDSGKCDISLTPSVEGEESAGKQGTAQSDCNSDEGNAPSKADTHRSFFSVLQTDDSNDAAASPGDCRLNSDLPESPPSDEQLDVTSEADESMKENTLSSPASDTAEHGASLDGQVSDDGFGNWDMDDINMEVVVYPDYFVYRDEYCTEAVVAFSSSCIKIKGSTGYEKKGSFNFQWGLDDIIDIKSQWCGRVGVAMIQLRVISKDAVQVGSPCGTSRIEELKFAVVDSNWLGRQEKITSLHGKYKSVWNVMLDTDMDGDALGEDNFIIPNSYFPKFDDHFEEVIYPKGDSDAVSISKRDIDLLQPETFINDTIIDFYIKYLKNKIQPEERHRFHFFNSFFFRKLADLDKDPSSASEGRAAFQRVRKWTRKVDLFEKDYIFIPVNFNLHWSLLVICHPGDAVNFKDDDVLKSLRVPCILHMDSIKGSHTGLKNIVQSYLWEEWKERHKETSEDISSKFFNLRFVPLELPQQENSFDCGLFLLHFAELFLEDAPVDFNPFRITKFCNFLNVNWFPPAEASLKRALIQRLIFELVDHCSQESSPAACSGEQQSPKFLGGSNVHETGVEFVTEKYSSVKACNGNLLSSHVDQGIEITLLTSSLSSQCVNDSSLVLREFFESGATAAGSFLDGQYQSFDQSSSFQRLKSVMSPIEEEETAEQFVYSPSCETGLQRLAGISHEARAVQYSSRDFRADASWNPGTSVEQAGHEEVDSSPETSTGTSEDSLEVGVDNGNTVRDNMDPSQIEKTDEPGSPSMENTECFTQGLACASGEFLEISAVESSQDTGKLDNCNEREAPLPSYEENPLRLFHEKSDIEGNRDITCKDVQLIDHDLESDPDEQPASKRLRLTPPPYEGERKLNRSLSKDLHL